MKELAKDTGQFSVFGAGGGCLQLYTDTRFGGLISEMVCPLRCVFWASFAPTKKFWAEMRYVFQSEQLCFWSTPDVLGSPGICELLAWGVEPQVLVGGNGKPHLNQQTTQPNHQKSEGS